MSRRLAVVACQLSAKRAKRPMVASSEQITPGGDAYLSSRREARHSSASRYHVTAEKSLMRRRLIYRDRAGRRQRRCCLRFPSCCTPAQLISYAIYEPASDENARSEVARSGHRRATKVELIVTPLRRLEDQTPARVAREALLQAPFSSPSCRTSRPYIGDAMPHLCHPR